MWNSCSSQMISSTYTCSDFIAGGTKPPRSEWGEEEVEKDENDSSDLPGLLSFRPFRLPHSRTLDIRTRICFWHRDLLLLGLGLRLLAIGLLAWSSLTARFCRMRELARAAIFPPSQLWEGGVFLPDTPFRWFSFCLGQTLEQDRRFGEALQGNWWSK